MTTYATNKSTVLSYVTIFESLWKELELNEQITNIFEQLKNQDSMRREFLTTGSHNFRLLSNQSRVSSSPTFKKEC